LIKVKLLSKRAIILAFKFTDRVIAQIVGDSKLGEEGEIHTVFD
jgi:hypothetical protein